MKADREFGGRLMMPTLEEWYAYLPESEHETFRRLWQTMVKTRAATCEERPEVAEDLRQRIAFDVSRMSA